MTTFPNGPNVLKLVIVIHQCSVYAVLYLKEIYAVLYLKEM